MAQRKVEIKKRSDRTAKMVGIKGLEKISNL